MISYRKNLGKNLGNAELSDGRTTTQRTTPYYSKLTRICRVYQISQKLANDVHISFVVSKSIGSSLISEFRLLSCVY